MDIEKVEEVRRDIEDLCGALSRPDRMVTCMPESHGRGKHGIEYRSAYWDALIDTEGGDERALTINYSMNRRPKFWIEEYGERGDIFKTTDLFSNWDKSKFEMEFSGIVSG